MGATTQESLVLSSKWGAMHSPFFVTEFIMALPQRGNRKTSTLTNHDEFPVQITQGQYLAFVYYYSKIHGCAPAEADMQAYFKVSPPSVHQMVLTLERNRLIKRTPGESRSIRLLLARENLPDLE